MKSSYYKKILHIVPQYKIGGVESMVASSVDEINKTINYKVLFIEKTKNGVDVNENSNFLFLESSFFLFPFTLTKFIKTIKRVNPDLIISSLWKSNVYVLFMSYLLGKQKIKCGIFIHNTRFEHFLDRAFNILALKRFPIILTDSNAATFFLQNSLKIKKHIFTAPLILNKSNSKGIKEFETNKTLRAVYTGRISKFKNIDIIILLIEKLVQLNVNLIFDIYGIDEGYLNDLMKLVAEKKMDKYICYKGSFKYNKIDSILKNYQLYIQLSEFEGMAISVSDAIRNGLVCFVNPVGEIKYYSKDMYNAVWLNLYRHNFDEQINARAVFLKNIILNEDLLRSISNNSRNTFNDAILYSENMINIFQKILSVENENNTIYYERR